MLFTFKAWAQYLAFSIRALLIRWRLPGYVADGEGIAREVFSSRCYKADGRVVPNTFSFNRSNDDAFSVNRISLVPEAFFQYLGLKHAKRRKLTYHGAAQLTAQNIRSVVMEDLWGANVLGSPTKENPFHADIPYPPDHGRDYDMAVQIQLARLTIFQPYRNAKQ